MLYFLNAELEVDGDSWGVNGIFEMDLSERSDLKSEITKVFYREHPGLERRAKQWYPVLNIKALNNIEI